MIALVCTALAGFYHPADTARESEAFQKASERSSRAASDAQSQARAVALAIRRFEEGLDLLGDREPDGQRDRHAELEKQYNRDFARMQAFADAMVEDFDGAFTAALDRALAAHPDGASAVRCQAEIASGPALPGMRPRMQANPECQGEALNAALAKAMDADPVLQADLDRLASREWPSLQVKPDPVAPVGGERWVEVASFFRGAMPDRLTAIDRADEEARIPFEAAIEQGADTEALRALTEEARKVDAQTRQKLSAAALPVLERADVVLAKQSPPGGWCAQPASLGGCTGTEDAAVAGALKADKKILKALR